MKHTVIHEVDDTKHRIVLMKDDGTNSAGEWFLTSDIAFHNGYFACVGESNLPQGVFKVKVVPHQLLA